jgi:hypothetical protein
MSIEFILFGLITLILYVVKRTNYKDHYVTVSILLVLPVCLDILNTLFLKTLNPYSSFKEKKNTFHTQIKQHVKIDLYILNSSFEANYVLGRTIAQAVSRWLPTAVAWVRARVWSCGIWWTKWRWGRFSSSTLVSPANLHSTNCSTITLIMSLGKYQYNPC